MITKGYYKGGADGQVPSLVTFVGRAAEELSAYVSKTSTRSTAIDQKFSSMGVFSSVRHTGITRAQKRQPRGK